MFGFLAGAAYSGNEDAGNALAGIFIGMIICLILAIIGGTIFGVSQWVTTESIAYETVIEETSVIRSGSSSKYIVTIENSFGEKEEVAVPYKEYKKYSENIGETVIVDAETSGVFSKSEKNHQLTLKNNLIAIKNK